VQSGVRRNKIVYAANGISTGYWSVKTTNDQGNALDRRFDNYFEDHNELFVDTTPPVEGNTCNASGRSPV